METAITKMFGIEFPILAFSHCRDVVAAVSKAGGMGVLGAVGHSDEALEVDLSWIKDEIGDRPYGVDLIVPASYTGDTEGGLQPKEVAALIPDSHKNFLNNLLDRYEIPRKLEPATSWTENQESAPFSLSKAEMQLDIALHHGPALIVNALGPPPEEMIKRAHGSGAKIAALAGTQAHAERHVEAGVDLVVAQGSEAGGHTGDIGSMVLIPEIVDAVSPIPVLGAGGIGSGRQMAAAMTLGAAGVWCGSIWLTTDEAETHPVVKQKMLSAKTTDTLRSRSLTGKPARMLKSAWTDEWDRKDTPDPLGMPLQPILTGRAQEQINSAAHQGGAGAQKLTTYFVGQVVGSMNRRTSSSQVVLTMIEEFVESVENVARQLET